MTMDYNFNRHCCRCFTFAFALFVSAHGSVVAAEYEMWVQRWGILDGRRLADYDDRSGQLLSIYRDGAVLWDVRTGLALRRYLPIVETSSLVQAGCILDEHILLGGTHFVSLLDKQNGDLVRSFDLEGGWLNSLVVNNKKSLFAALTRSGQLSIWEIKTGRRLHVIDAQQMSGEMEFSPDSRWLLSGSDENVARMWNVETGELYDEFNSPSKVQRIAFSDDGRRMLTSGHGNYWHTGRLVVWDVATRRPLQVIPRNVMDASFSGDNVRIVHPGGEVELWAPDRHEDPLPPEEWPKPSGGGSQFLRITGNHWVLHSPRDASRLTLTGPTSDEANSAISQELPRYSADDHIPLAISQDGRLLLTGGGSHGNRPSRSAVWDLRRGKLLLELENEVLGEFHPDCSRVVLSRGKQLVVVDVETGEKLKTLELTDKKYANGVFTSLRFTKDGKHLLTATGSWYDGNGGGILLWDFESGKLLKDYHPKAKAVMFAEMSRDEKWIVAALTPGLDGSASVDQLSVFDAMTGELTQTKMFPHYGSSIGPVSTASRLVAASSRKGTFDGKMNEGENSLFSLPEIVPKVNLPEKTRPSCFSPDGEFVASFESRNTLGFRDSTSGALLHAYETQLHSIRPILFHPGQRLLCGALFDPWNIQDHRAVGVGLEEILTGELQAELTLFREPGSWLMTARNGSVNGSGAGLSRVTWRRRGSIEVIRDSERTKNAVDSQRLAEAVLKPEGKGPVTRDQLKRMSPPVISDSDLKLPPEGTGFKNYNELGRQAANVFREAGADVETDIHGQSLALELKELPITAELLKQLRNTYSLERLTLVRTGIQDEQLKNIGLLPSLKRLTLQEKSVTDHGLVMLAALWNLEVLDVHQTQVTAAGLNSLHLLPNLKTVIVPETINPADLAPLKKYLAKLEVIRKSNSK